ncbi:MAG: class I SAM-dependent methyltransferase [Planctomycetes bacterium]|nr:class I SAM-dependent methyltransferase [Planctomycetota bacterium]
MVRIASNIRRHSQEKFTVWRCANCRSLHCKEAIDLDHYYSDYFTASHRLDWVTRLSYDVRLRWLRRQGYRKAHCLLDYGCGSGAFIEYLRGRGYQAFGYDPYSESFGDRSLLSRRFDVVTSWDVIEHVSDPRSMLSQQAELVQDDGLLLVGTPEAGGIDLQRPHTVELHQPYHRHILSERALVDLAAQIGWHAVEIKRRYHLDTLVPVVNTRFIWEYVYANDNLLDVVVESPRFACVFQSPRLLFFSVAGYFFPPRQAMQVFFRRVR